MHTLIIEDDRPQGGGCIIKLDGKEIQCSSLDLTMGVNDVSEVVLRVPIGAVTARVRAGHVSVITESWRVDDARLGEGTK